MASNFRIMTHRNSENLHLKLLGDFDGISAWEVVNALKQNCNGARKIFIHTNSLKNIFAFGRQTFHQKLPEAGINPDKLVFTGEKSGEIRP